MDPVRLRWAVVAVVAAVLVRLPAVTTLPIDWDEPIYMDASSEAAAAMAAANWGALSNPRLNREHPPLVKMIYGASMLPHGDEPTLVQRLASTRGVALTAGIGLVAMVAWAHPAAGVVLATHTIHAKYSSQAYLDSLPLLWMTTAMLLGWSARHRMGSGRGIAAAACWGAACAGKWIHGLPGLVLVAAVPGWSSRMRLLATALACAFVMDPTSWFGPWGRLTEMVGLHMEYAAGLPAPSQWWQPWLHLGSGGPARWHPEAFPASLDGLWLVLAMVGLFRNWRDPWARFLAAWWAVPMLLFMAWDTRWPQHAMVVVVPVCLSAALGLREMFSRASRRFGPSATRPPASE